VQSCTLGDGLELRERAARKAAATPSSVPARLA
jgi:hypothetical protein